MKIYSWVEWSSKCSLFHPFLSLKENDWVVVTPFMGITGSDMMQQIKQESGYDT